MYKEIINTSHKLSTKKYNKDMGNPKAFLTIPRQEAGTVPSTTGYQIIAR